MLQLILKKPPTRKIANELISKISVGYTDVFVSRNIIRAILIKTSFLASLSIILFTNSITPIVKLIDVFAQADDSVDAAPTQAYISDDNSDNKNGESAAVADSTRDNKNPRFK